MIARFSPPASAANPWQWLAVAVPAIVLVWRLVGSPAGNLWRDWAALISLYGLCAAFRGRSQQGPQLVLSMMAYLLGIYLLGHWPQVLIAWGCSP